MLEEKGQRFTSNSTRRFPASEIQDTWSPGSSTTTCGMRPTSTGRSAISFFHHGCNRDDSTLRPLFTHCRDVPPLVSVSQEKTMLFYNRTVLRYISISVTCTSLSLTLLRAYP